MKICANPGAPQARRLTLVVLAAMVLARPAAAQTALRIVPPEGATLAVGQRVDIRVEATSPGRPGAPPPRGLVVTIDGVDVTAGNALGAGGSGARGEGGMGTPTAGSLRDVSPAPANTTNFLLQAYSFAQPGTHTVKARTADGATASARLEVLAWRTRRPGTARAKNVIFFLGDGMGVAHRTAARILARGVTLGKANGRLAMDSMPVTGQVMTFSLNSVITDSAPGMSAYVTGNKSNNNHEGVYPDNTAAAFDNPRAEYFGAMLRRVRGPGFNVGIVTTADVTDATPAANAVHTAARSASGEIARRFFEERSANGVTVLMGGGRAHFVPREKGGRRSDGRDLLSDFREAGYRVVSKATEMRGLLEGKPPERVLGLFHPGHMSVAFDKVGAGRYSDELSSDDNASLRDQPMLDEMTRVALKVLESSSPAGFYLMVEGASIDKQAHAADSERTIWDTIEMDNAVAVALEFARRTNGDANPDNDTLVIVTADHECGGLGLIGVGNERYAPQTLGRAVRDYAAVFRFTPEQELDFFTNYQPDERGYPTNPDPSRKLLLGWSAAPDRYENWTSNRRMLPPAIDPVVITEGKSSRSAIANPARDGAEAGSDNQTVTGQAIAGFLVPGTIENGELACTEGEGCPADVSSVPLTISGHTAADVTLSAFGPGMFQFTGTYDNTEVFVKMLRAAAGGYGPPR